MASSTMAHQSSQPSPLTRTLSPFKNPRPPPCTPAKTAQLWEEYERIAVENAKKRERNSKTAQPLRNSASDMGKIRCSASTSRSSFDFKYRTAPAPASNVTICKTCKQHITYASGICERCKKTIILPSAGESTPPLSPSARNFASTDLHLLEKKVSLEDQTPPPSASPKRKALCPPTLHLSNPPIRLSSLQPPPLMDSTTDPNRSRKVSLTDPNEPFLRLQVAHQATPRSYSIPTTPTYPPTTPPAEPRSCGSTRPSSYAMTSPLSPAYTRHNSVTPSELSTLFPYSTTTTDPPSLHRISNALQNTTSAWDDWDSDGEERVRLIGYWKRGRAKDKGKERERADSKVSDERSEPASRRGSCEAKEAKKERAGGLKGVGSGDVGASVVGEGKKKKHSKLLRALRCGC